MGILKKIKRVLGGQPASASRRFVPDPRHWYIVSYPKSGNTWMRFLLAHVLFPGDDEITFPRLGSMVPDACRTQDRDAMRDGSAPFARCAHPFVKTHDPYAPEYRRVLYIVRDGRDALTSYYHWQNARRETPLSLADIVRGDSPHGSWSKHVLGWMHGEADAKVVVKYEDLLADTAGQLRRILDATGVPAEDAAIERAVRLSSFDSMKRAEREHGLFDGGKAMSEVMPFVRKGKAGDWRTLFGEPELALFWQIHGEAMRAAGYGEDDR